jgi:phenylalanyl-tRNA synthetase beta chain
VYPFIVRDIAFWTSEGTEAGELERIIRENASELLVRIDQFDKFEKEGRTSYAYRIVFQAPDRTLTDEEVNGVMEKVYSTLRAVGYEVR